MVNWGNLIAKVVRFMPKINRKLSWLTAGLLAGYWLSLFIATHLPRIRLPSISNGDKVAHFAAYAGLAFLMSGAFTVRLLPWRTSLVFVLAICAVYGAVDEITQMLVPGRTADVLDWFADMVGAAIGIGLFWASVPLLRFARAQLLRTEPAP